MPVANPLMLYSLLLVEVLLPHLRDTAHPSSISMALSALQVEILLTKPAPCPLQAQAHTVFKARQAHVERQPFWLGVCL